jgi:hypothetical protein
MFSRNHSLSRSADRSGLFRASCAKKGRRTGRVGRHLGQSLVEGTRDVFGASVVDQIGHHPEGSQPASPAIFSVGRPELHAHPHRFGVLQVAVHQMHDGFRDDQREILPKPGGQTFGPVFDRVPRPARIRSHVEFSVSHLGRITRDVVGPKVEGIPARQIKTGVMPVAGEDAVLNRPLRQRKSHVRAPIVDGVELPFVVEDRQIAPLDVDAHASLLPNLACSTDMNEVVTHGETPGTG